MGIGAGGLRFRAVSQHVSFDLVFSGATRSLGGAKPRADERSEKAKAVVGQVGAQ